MLVDVTVVLGSQALQVLPGSVDVLVLTAGVLLEGEEEDHSDQVWPGSVEEEVAVAGLLDELHADQVVLGSAEVEVVDSHSDQVEEVVGSTLVLEEVHSLQVDGSVEVLVVTEGVLEVVLVEEDQVPHSSEESVVEEPASVVLE